MKMGSHEAYLRGALSKYRHVDLTKRDITSCIQQYTDIRPQRDTFVFNDGSHKELLCLYGTIPVSYKGQLYNIPVCLWLLETHPYSPPMAYVKPTSTMQIKPGRHVDSNGRVFLPYLKDWKYSDLLGLVQVLVIVFGEEMPVFSRSAAPSHAPPPSVGTGSAPHPTTGAACTTGALSHSEEQIKASLLSAVGDKMQLTLREIFVEAQAEKIRQGLSDMETDDEAVITKAPLYRQLFAAFVEEQVTENTIYYLGEALRTGVIDLDLFLKQAHEVSTKQFMMRAWTNKF